MADSAPRQTHQLRREGELLATFWFFRLLPVRADRAEDFTGQMHRLLELFAGP